MHLDDLLARLDKVGAAREFSSDELPDVEMYMEQLLITLNGKLNLRSNADRLTKDMVHVYLNNGLLPLPRKKKFYHKEHAVLLSLIYQLKDILSMKEIRQLLTPWLKEIESSGDEAVSFEEVYSAFSTLKEARFAQWRDRIVKNFSEVLNQSELVEARTNFRNTDQFFVVLLLVVQASMLSQVAKGIIKDYFAEEANDSDTEAESTG